MTQSTVRKALEPDPVLAEIAEKAAEFLEINEWGQGVRERRGGKNTSYCMGEALFAVSPYFNRGAWENIQKDYFKRTTIAHWNDHSERTKEEVVAELLLIKEYYSE